MPLRELVPPYPFLILVAFHHKQFILCRCQSELGTSIPSPSPLSSLHPNHIIESHLSFILSFFHSFSFSLLYPRCLILESLLRRSLQCTIDGSHGAQCCRYAS
jgi:hypothetical protein